MNKTIMVDDISFCSLDELLCDKKVPYVVLESGEVREVIRYNTEKHLIQLDDGRDYDLMTLLYKLQSYGLIVEEHVSKTSHSLPNKKVAKTKKKPFSVYALAEGKPGKKYTIKQFLEIYKKSEKRVPSKPHFETKLDDGYIYKGDSNEEKVALNKLIYHDAFKRLRGQAPKIEYRFKGGHHSYYPDFFLITNTNKIIVIEIKQVAQMNSKENVTKYNALRKYCNRLGFLYMMCDKTFITYQSLKHKKGSAKVECAIEEALIEKGCFDYDDYLQLTDGLTYKKIKWMRKAIGIYISSNPDVVMHGDLAYKIKKLKIKYKN